MINVLHLRDTSRICGPGKTIIETVCAVDRSQFKLSIGLFLAQHQTRNDYMDAAVARGITVHPIRSSCSLDVRVLRTLMHLVQEQRIDIVHAHDYRSDILTAALGRFTDVATMTTIHGWITNTRKRRAYVWLSQRALPLLDRVVAVSNQTRARVLAAGVPEAKLVVIHNAIVTQNYDPSGFTRGAFRRSLGIPDSAFLVGNIGRLSPEKGQVDFLRAGATLAARHPRSTFVLVGDGPDRERLAREAERLRIGKRVFFTGHLDDVRPALRDMDALALTSYTEGFPNVLLESLCMDTPVLASDVGGVAEIVEHYRTGMLVQPRDVDAIAAGLWAYAVDPELSARLAAAGKARVFRQFAFAHRTLKEECVYRELMHLRATRAKGNNAESRAV